MRNCCETGCCGPTEVMQMHGCCGHRRFLTKEEKLERLEEYKDGLEKELKGVKESINELKAV